MSDRILGPSESRRRGYWRRYRILLAVGSVAALGVFLISNAVAVHDETFQLDGDVSASSTTSVPKITTTTTGTTTTTTTTPQTQLIDWSSLFGITNIPASPPLDPTPPEAPAELALPAGFNASGFHVDLEMKRGSGPQRGETVFSSGDDSTYTTGSKDTLSIGIPEGGNKAGWQCAHSNNVGGKVDIMNAYAAAFTDPDTGDEILYFGQERNANDGDANVGFWFLQDGTVDCSSEGGGAEDFTGHHVDGDLFIVSAFTAGGDVSEVTVYRWNGDDTGFLDPDPVASGADCQGSDPEPPGDDACATVNAPDDGTGGTITTPWVTANKDDGLGKSLRTSEFFEGGVNLTANDLGGKCFNTFVSNTRSSQSLPATIFDFAVGQLGLCSISTTQEWFPQDSATVTGITGGTVTFKLYENGTCTGSPAQTFVDSDGSNGFKTNNTSYSISDTGANPPKSISWSATFDPPEGSDVESFDTTRCERSDLTINNSASDFPPPPTP